MISLSFYWWHDASGPSVSSPFLSCIDGHSPRPRIYFNLSCLYSISSESFWPLERAFMEIETLWCCLQYMYLCASPPPRLVDFVQRFCLHWMIKSLIFISRYKLFNFSGIFVKIETLISQPIPDKSLCFHLQNQRASWNSGPQEGLCGVLGQERAKDFVLNTGRPWLGFGWEGIWYIYTG